MNNVKKYKLMDLIENIKEVDAMIHLHSNDDSSLILDQYNYKKDKLIGFLIDELVEPEFRSAKSMFVIKTVIEKFYPNLKKEILNDTLHDDLNELTAALA
ncbi:MAG: hypothetical protein EBQ94_10625 [Flavobacteriales bacterium]|nr:hypothetical protein [Flavobacteriales bacterium]NCA20046.1 hypothetical protein [Crocinitomicaceae bacterium]